MANQLYIASAAAPFSDRFQEMLDMLMTGAAFGLPTTLWLTDGCLAVLAAMPDNESLKQLADFGVRCVVSDTAQPCRVPVDILSAQDLKHLRDDCKQALVF